MHDNKRAQTRPAARSREHGAPRGAQPQDRHTNHHARPRAAAGSAQGRCRHGSRALVEAIEQTPGQNGADTSQSVADPAPTARWHRAADLQRRCQRGQSLRARFRPALQPVRVHALRHLGAADDHRPRARVRDADPRQQPRGGLQVPCRLPGREQPRLQAFPGHGVEQDIAAIDAGAPAPLQPPPAPELAFALPPELPNDTAEAGEEGRESDLPAAPVAGATARHPHGNGAAGNTVGEGA